MRKDTLDYDLEPFSHTYLRIDSIRKGIVIDRTVKNRIVKSDHFKELMETELADEYTWDGSVKKYYQQPYLVIGEEFDVFLHKRMPSLFKKCSKITDDDLTVESKTDSEIDILHNICNVGILYFDDIKSYNIKIVGLRRSDRIRAIITYTVYEEQLKPIPS